MKIYTFILLMLVLTGSSLAQIVLGPERQITIGDKFTTEQIDPTDVNEGPEGENQNWDFNGLVSQDALVMEYIDASTTPYHADFPGATMAGVISEGEIASYTYFSVSDGKVYSYGTVSGDFSNVYTDHQITASYPFSYGSSFNDTFEGVTDLGDGFISKKQGEISSLGDAYGMITLPDGSVHNSLRVKSVQSSVDSMFMDDMFIGENKISSTTYTWYINGAKFPVFSVSHIRTEVLGNVIISKSVVYSPQLTTGVEDEKISPANFVLSQNFPNPYNPATNISYSLKEKSFITLKVYNVIGKEIAVLVNGEKEAGEYTISFNAADLPAGVYFYTLSTKNSRETKKMTLLK